MATFTCPGGAICSDQARTYVGRTVSKGPRGTVVTNQGTGIFHRTVTRVTQDTSGKVSGSETLVYVEKMVLGNLQQFQRMVVRLSNSPIQTIQQCPESLVLDYKMN